MRKIYIVFLIIMTALLLRCVALDKSFQGDELLSVLDARDLNNVTLKLMNDSHPPLYFYMLHFWMKVSANEAFLRFLSVMFGIGLCVIVYLLGKEMFEEQTGLIAALVSACAPVAVWSSQYVRTYSAAVFFIALSILFLVKLIRSEGKSIFYWAGFTLSSIAAMYTFYFAALFIIAENIFIFFVFLKRSRFLQKWIASQSLIFAAYLPWIPFFLSQRSSYAGHPQIMDKIGFYTGSLNIGAIMRGGAGMIGIDPRFMAKHALSYHPVAKVLAGFIVAAALILFILIVLKQVRSANNTREERIFTLLLLSLAIIPFGIAVIMSRVFKIVLMSHYFIAGFICLLLFLVFAVNRSGPKFFKKAVLPAVIILYLLRLVFLYSDKGMDFKGAREYIQKTCSAKTALVSPSQSTFGGLVGYYLGDVTDIYYFDTAKIQMLDSKELISITLPEKLELKKYHKDLGNFLTKRRYMLNSSSKFGDLVLERYKKS